MLWLLAATVHKSASYLKPPSTSVEVNMSACKLQQLRSQHTFASALSPPWWPFLAERQSGQLEVVASKTTQACIARACHLCTVRTPAKVVAWLYNFTHWWSGKAQKNDTSAAQLAKRTSRRFLHKQGVQRLLLSFIYLMVSTTSLFLKPVSGEESHTANSNSHMLES